MKARVENGKTKLYSKLPSRYKSETLNIAGGFDKLPASVHEAEGFFPVVVPEGFDTEIKELGEMYFDDNNSVFTYPVVDIQFDIEALRAEKKQEFINCFNTVVTTITQAQFAIDPADAGKMAQFDAAVATTREIQANSMSFICNETDPVKLKKFHVRKEDVDSVLSLFDQFLS